MKERREGKRGRRTEGQNNEAHAGTGWEGEADGIAAFVRCKVDLATNERCTEKRRFGGGGGVGSGRSVAEAVSECPFLRGKLDDTGSCQGGGGGNGGNPHF